MSSGGPGALDRKTIRAWCLYDFADSAFIVNFTVIYGTMYAEHVVGGSRGDWWWGIIGSFSMLLVVLSAPLLGGVADHAGVRKRMLALYTGVGLAAVLAFTAVEPGMVWFGFLAGTIANFAFEGAIVFYNAYLPDIAPPSHHGRVSAWGFAVGYVGSLAALGLALPFAMKGHTDVVWFLTAAQWALFALPAFRRLPPDRPTGMSVFSAAGEGVRSTWRTLKDVAGRRELRRFLLGCFFWMNGVNTVIFFAAVYAKKTFGMGEGELIGFYAAILVTALAGSWVMAKPTDVLGPRWAVRVQILWWIGVVTAAALVPGKLTFWIVGLLAGLGIGGIQSCSRAFMSRLIPDGREAELFGFYAFCGRTGAILGPWLFGATSRAFGSQRPAVFSVALFFVAGLLFLRGIRAGGPLPPP